MTNVVQAARALNRSGRSVQGAFDFLGAPSAAASKFPIGELSPDVLQSAMVRWLALGHAISFGLSGDGGALGIHLIANGEKRSKWFGHVAEAEDFLSTVPGPE